MFGRIAARYDLANRVLSGGLDRGWRSRLVDSVRRSGARMVVDVATGSGDIAFALRRALPESARIVGVDFCLPMLEEARRKQRAAGAAAAGIEFIAGDALALPLPDGSADAVTIAFGLRNLVERGRGLAEMRRVLRPGGRLLILEFSQPRAWVRPFYRLYLGAILPRLAGLLTGEPSAYVYLGDTIGRFPDRSALSAEIRAAGFASVSSQALSLGVVALHEAVRQGPG
jgi:demethylmenaquinone methyltransferase/2-methoxy-6-polyprenyl-1,4-benzoquinol methylase